MAAVEFANQRSRFWRFRWRASTVVLLSVWAAILCVGLGAIMLRSWQGDMACPAPQSEVGESHWSYKDFGHYCSYQGVQTTEPSLYGRVWLATVVVAGIVVVASVASCVTPPRRPQRESRP